MKSAFCGYIGSVRGLRRVVLTDVALLPGDLDLSPEWSAWALVRYEINAQEAGLVVSVGDTLVLCVDPRVSKTKICPPVVQGIAVDVIHDFAPGGPQDQPVHQSPSVRMNIEPWASLGVNSDTHIPTSRSNQPCVLLIKKDDMAVNVQLRHLRCPPFCNKEGAHGKQRSASAATGRKSLGLGNQEASRGAFAHRGPVDAQPGLPIGANRAARGKRSGGPAHSRIAAHETCPLIWLPLSTASRSCFSNCSMRSSDSITLQSGVWLAPWHFSFGQLPMEQLAVKSGLGGNGHSGIASQHIPTNIRTQHLAAHGLAARPGQVFDLRAAFGRHFTNSLAPLVDRAGRQLKKSGEFGLAANHLAGFGNGVLWGVHVPTVAML